MNAVPSPSVRPITRIPLHLLIQRGGDTDQDRDEYFDEETLAYQVTLRVQNNRPEGRTVAVVQDHPRNGMRVVKYPRAGELALPREALDRLVLLCFGRLARALLGSDLDGESADLWVVDAVPWLRKQLASDDADLVVAAFLPLVDPTVQGMDWTWISD